jgi:hypothetical protein
MLSSSYFVTFCPSLLNVADIDFINTTRTALNGNGNFQVANSSVTRVTVATGKMILHVAYLIQFSQKNSHTFGQ